MQMKALITGLMIKCEDFLPRITTTQGNASLNYASVVDIEMLALLDLEDGKIKDWRNFYRAFFEILSYYLSVNFSVYFKVHFALFIHCFFFLFQ